MSAEYGRHPPGVGGPHLSQPFGPAFGVFISYRHADSEDATWRIYQALEKRLEPYPLIGLFIDQINISLADDFVKRLNEALDASVLVLVIIGPGWLPLLGTDNPAQPQNKRDFVQLEIATALKKEIAILPICVNGAALPLYGSLPPEIAALANRHAFELPDEHWDFGIDRIVDLIHQRVEIAKRDARVELERIRRGAGKYA